MRTPLNHFWSTRADHAALQSLWDEGVTGHVTLLGETQFRALLSRSHCGANDAATAIERTCGAGDGGERLVRYELEKDEYGLGNLRALGSGDAYLDIGGHIGLPVIKMAARFPLLHIVCVEPMPENYVFIKWNLLRALGTRNHSVVVLNRAVSSASGESLQLSYMPNASTNSGGFKDEGLYKWAIQHTVQTISLAEVLYRHIGARRVRLLKLDCEGCEWQAVAALSDAQFDALFQPRKERAAIEPHLAGASVGELHFISSCPQDVTPARRKKLACDDAFAQRTCAGEQQMHGCCVTYGRLCPAHLRRKDMGFAEASEGKFGRIPWSPTKQPAFGSECHSIGKWMRREGWRSCTKADREISTTMMSETMERGAPSTGSSNKWNDDDGGHANDDDADGNEPILGQRTELPQPKGAPPRTKLPQARGAPPRALALDLTLAVLAGVVLWRFLPPMRVCQALVSDTVDMWCI